MKRSSKLTVCGYTYYALNRADGQLRMVSKRGAPLARRKTCWRVVLAITLLVIHTIPAGAQFEQIHLKDEQRTALRVRSLHQLEKALRSAQDTDDILLLLRVAQTSTGIHGAIAMPMVRQVRDLLGSGQWKPRYGIPQAILARLAAPFDVELRDELLTEAIEASRLVSPAEIYPKPHRDDRADQYEILMELERELWKSVVTYRSRPAPSAERLRKLLSGGKEAGIFLSEAGMMYDNALLRRLCVLEPRLLFEVWSETKPADKLSGYCASAAHDALGSFREVLITHAVRNGEQGVRALQIYRTYAPEDAYHMAHHLPRESYYEEHDRKAALPGIIELWAWRDPEKALQEAERETDTDLRRELVDKVSFVWAHKRPEDIERALRHQDNEYRKDRARKMAAAELDRRSRGLPAQDSPEKIPPTGRTHRLLGKTLPPEEKPCLTDLRTRYEASKTDSQTHSLYALHFFRALTRTDPELSLEEARKLAGKQRSIALYYVAAYTAPYDWAKGWQILKESGYDERQGVPYDLGEAYLLAHPTETFRIHGRERQGILNQAAASGYRKSLSLDVMEAIIASLSDRNEVDQVLRYCTSHIAKAGDPAVAEKLADRIHDPSVSCIARCELAKNMLDDWY